MQAKSAAKKEKERERDGVKDHGRKDQEVIKEASVGPGEGRATSRAKEEDEEGRKVVESVAAVVKTARRSDTLHYVEKKLVDKGIHRLERHPVDGLGLAHPPPKSGHGGKYTWEGPVGEAESELDPAPPAIDPKDPNYVDEEEEERILDEVEGERPPVIGAVEVAKVAELVREGVSRIEVEPPLKNLVAGTAAE